MNGGVVCRFHGGAAPQVLEAARRRLAMMLQPALASMSEYVTSELKNRKRRIKSIEQRIDQLKQIIDERAQAFKDLESGTHNNPPISTEYPADIATEISLEPPDWALLPAYASKIPGGKTGHIVYRKKAVGNTVVDEFAVDTGLLLELRRLEEQLRTEQTDYGSQLSVLKDLMDRAGLKTPEPRGEKTDKLDELVAASKSMPPPEEEGEQVAPADAVAEEKDGES